MCGIVGYIGKEKTTPLLLQGLKRLEYRGYDSAGLALSINGSLTVLRQKGNLDQLEKIIDHDKLDSRLGIGHTRWATHGEPSERNSHPHTDCSGKIAVVHNGIIENWHELRDELIDSGHEFTSETDTETLAHLVEANFNGDLKEAVKKALRRIKGSYAIAVISSEDPSKLIAARKDSPLVLGIAESGIFVASDIPALIDQTRKIVIIEDEELVEVAQDGYQITSGDDVLIKRDSIEVKWDIEAAEKGGFADFMLKEIYEQPSAIQDTLRGQLDEDGKVNFDDLLLDKEKIEDIDKIFIVACGTSLHAGMIAKLAIEKWAHISVEIDCSSEFRYREPVLSDKSLLIAITQSGETADTLAGIRKAKEKGAKIIAVTNVVGSSITREADGVVYTHAGPEIGVAATKTHVSQIAALILLSMFIARQKNGLDDSFFQKIAESLSKVPEKVDEILGKAETIKEWAKKYHDVYDFLFIGRGVGYPVAMEGALKLKEISYIHAEGYPAGEMKHGPIALINDGVPVLAIALKGKVFEKIVSNMQEAKSRGGSIIAITDSDDNQIRALTDDVFVIPESDEMSSAILSVIPLQLLSYFIAKERGCNVDQPRNLAKSVTVE